MWVFLILFYKVKKYEKNLSKSVFVVFFFKKSRCKWFYTKQKKIFLIGIIWKYIYCVVILNNNV